MNLYQRSALLAAFLGAFATMQVIAQQPGPNNTPPNNHPMGAKFFEYLDQNKDGQISREEFDQAGRERQQRQQADKPNREHGQAEKGGRQERRQHWVNAMFDRADRNDDGVVSKGEFLIGAERMFERLDRNSDGLLQKNELKHQKR